MDTGIKCKPEVAETLNKAAIEKTEIAYCIFKLESEAGAPGRKAKEWVVLHKVEMITAFPDDNEVRQKCDEKQPPPSFVAMHKELVELKHAYALYTFNWLKEGGVRTLPLFIKYLDENNPSTVNMRYTGTWATVKKQSSKVTCFHEANDKDDISYKVCLDAAKFLKKK